MVTLSVLEESRHLVEYNFNMFSKQKKVGHFLGWKEDEALKILDRMLHSSSLLSYEPCESHKSAVSFAVASLWNCLHAAVFSPTITRYVSGRLAKVSYVRR